MQNQALVYTMNAVRSNGITGDANPFEIPVTLTGRTLSDNLCLNLFPPSVSSKSAAVLFASVRVFLF